MKKNFMLFLILMLTAAVALTGCGGQKNGGGEGENNGKTELTDWEYITSEGKGELIVGLDDTFAPMGFRDENNELVGFDVDLARAVGEKLGIAVTFKPIDWDSKELELKARTIDCIWNGMSVTPERMENMQLTDQYLNNRIVIMSLKDDVKITEAKDLANYKIGTQVDSAALKVMTEHPDWDAFSAKVSEYKTYDEAILDMKAGRISCIVVDEVLGEYKNAKMNNAMQLAEFNFGDDYYAIGCRKGDVELVAKINGALQELIDDGTAAKISEKWFGTNIVILKGYDK